MAERLTDADLAHWQADVDADLQLAGSDTPAATADAAMWLAATRQGRLLAEVRRLREIERAARAYADACNTEDAHYQRIGSPRAEWDRVADYITGVRDAASEALVALLADEQED